MFSTSLRAMKLSSKARREPSIHSLFTTLKLSLSQLQLADIELRQSGVPSERPVQRSKRLFAMGGLTPNRSRRDRQRRKVRAADVVDAMGRKNPLSLCSRLRGRLCVEFAA